MHWGKVGLHGLMMVILFLVAAVIVNPLTDGIDDNTIRVTVKEMMRIGLTVGMLWWYVRLFFKNRAPTFVFKNWSRRTNYGS